MKICIDIRPTLKKATGIGKYTLNLINALAEVDPENSYYLYSRKKILDFKRRLPKLPGANFSHRVDYFKKGVDAVLPGIDIFHTSSYDLDRPKKAKYIVTVHDVIIKAYPYGHSEKTIREIDEKLKRVLNEADALVADSHSTKKDLMKFYDVAESRISVIYPGVQLFEVKPRTWTPSAPVRGLTSNIPYILFVGTLEPRKNIDGLIKAFNWLKKEQEMDHKLYIVGMKGWMFENIFKEYEKSEFKKDIIFKGYVSEHELSALYQNASLFVYPSFYEGFGLPIVEAFSHGVPVVTSKTSSCGEIAGGSASLVDPSNSKEIGEAMAKFIADKNLREQLTRRGLERAKQFTWRNTANEFLKLVGEP